MSEPCTAQPLPVIVRVNSRDFLWDAASGLDPEVVSALHAFICREALKVKGLGRARGLSFDDLVQEGSVGVLKAARNYDPARGVVFITYAWFWIRQAIMQAVTERAVAIPGREHTAMVKTGGLPPVCSLDGCSEDEERALIHCLGQAPTQDMEAEEHQARIQVWRALRLLHGRFREVIIRRWGLVRDPETLAEIGASWGLSRERVRQIEVVAISRLKKAIR